MNETTNTNGTTIRGLSLWQPWASLIAVGAKSIETRSWSTDYRGLVAIHAAKHQDGDSRKLAGTEPFASALAGVAYDDLPYGAIVAVAELVDCIPTPQEVAPGVRVTSLTYGDVTLPPPEPERSFGDYSPGRFGWVLRSVRRLPEPIPCKGGLQLFTVPEEAAAKLAEALKGMEQQAAGPVLKWEQQVGGDGWDAENTANVRDPCDVEIVPRFYIDRDADGTYCVDGQPELFDPAPPAEPFATLEEAKAWCERRNAELVAAAQPPSPADRDATGDVPFDLQRDESDNPPPAGIDADTWTDILDARRLERDAEKDVEQLKEDLKEAKDRHEAASKRLGRLLDDAERTKNGEPRLPFGKAAEGQNEGSDIPNPIPEKYSNTAPAEDESWRSVLIAVLEPKLTAGKLKVLSEHVPPILTMGDMAAWQQQKGDFWVKDLKGFGPGGAEQYELAATRYFEEHPREHKAPADTAPAKLTHRKPTEAEVESGKFAPESAAHFVAYFTPNAARPEEIDDGVESLADLILNDAAAFQAVWGGVEAVRPGTPDHDAKSPFNEDGWRDLLKAAAVLHRHHTLSTNQLEQALDAPAKPAVPDHLDIEEESVVTHIEHDDGKGGKLWVHTAQRGSGQYCYSYRVELGILDHEVKWTGRFPDLASAIAAAVEDCSAWINGHDRGKDNPATRKGQLRSIRAAPKDLAPQPVGV